MLRIIISKDLAWMVLACCMLVFAALHAQDPSRGPDNSTRTSVPGIIILSIPNAPFSGMDNIEWTRTSSDGTKVVMHLQAALARDSEGRVYRENRSFVSANSQVPAPLNNIHIYDPTIRAQMLCYLRTYTCDIWD